MIFKRSLAATLLAIFGCTAIVFAATPMPMQKPQTMVAPKISDKPVGPLETRFVRSVQADLMKRFPKAADAEKAGYLRFTNADESGAISYANGAWQSLDEKHPSQLWYDVKGELLGADYSVLRATSATAPHLWGINPARWLEFKEPHYHFILKDPKSGEPIYGAVGGKKYLAAGGVPEKPDPAVIVKLGKAASETQVVKVFEFPALWDLQVWLKPNPNGAFADKNPNVTPSSHAASHSM